MKVLLDQGMPRLAAARLRQAGIDPVLPFDAISQMERKESIPSSQAIFWPNAQE